MENYRSNYRASSVSFKPVRTPLEARAVRRLATTHAVLWLALWLLVVLTSLLTRSLWPIDETRYATVAWEMWLRGDFLLPHLNGAAYSHKPPLMFWLFQLGWWLFGVNDWWPRIVPALFALLNLFLTARLARQLWPEQELVARYAPLILLGFVAWTFFTTVTLFDMLLTSFALLGICGILHAWRHGGMRGWLLLGLAIGLGLLAKGPIILLHTLPVALLMPWWGKQCGKQSSAQQPADPAAASGQPANQPAAFSWRYWYGGMLGAVALGAAMGLAWAIPAAAAGGVDYAQAILWGQTTERLVDSFAHQRPWWWYVAMLPLLLLPWLLWAPLWRGFKQVRSGWRRGVPDPGLRFCLAWLLPVFICLSLISGKQVHYMVPLLPGFALLISHLIFAPGAKPARRDSLLPAGCILLFGLLVALAPTWVLTHIHQPEWIAQLTSLPGVLAVICGAVLLVKPVRSYADGITALSLASVALLVVAYAGVLRLASPDYDVKPIANYLKGLQDSGYVIAHINKYYGQYNFLGRLEQPLEVIDGFAASTWSRLHPRSKIISYGDVWHPSNGLPPDYQRDYRGTTVYIWDRSAFLNTP